MAPLPPLREGDRGLLVTYTIESDQDVYDAIVDAFLLAGIDVYSEPTQIADWIDPDVIEGLDLSDSQTYLGTQLWDNHVVLTSEAVRIYDTLRSG